VVLLHAGVADRTMWAELRPAIVCAGYRVIAPDLPGYGDAVPGADLAPWSDVLQTLDSLGVRRFALIGNSFGGAIALDIAVCAPDRIAALLLVSAPPLDLTPSDELQAVWGAEESALDRGDIDGAVRGIVDAWTLPGDSRTRDRVASMQRRAFELQLAAGELREVPEPVEADRGALAHLGIPVLVAAGERDMADFATGAASLARELGAQPPAVIAGAGHLAPLEQPDAFRSLALGFLSEAAPAW
jgi:pimeloyl-ACP methyl ester carboxylesterase